MGGGQEGEREGGTGESVEMRMRVIRASRIPHTQRDQPTNIVDVALKNDDFCSRADNIPDVCNGHADFGLAHRQSPLIDAVFSLASSFREVQIIPIKGQVVRKDSENDAIVDQHDDFVIVQKHLSPEDHVDKTSKEEAPPTQLVNLLDV